MFVVLVPTVDQHLHPQAVRVPPRITASSQGSVHPFPIARAMRVTS